MPRSTIAFLMLRSDYNVWSLTVIAPNNLIQYSHCQVVQLFQLISLLIKAFTTITTTYHHNHNYKNIEGRQHIFVCEDLTPLQYKLLKYMQKSCSDTFTSCYTQNGNIKAKLKTTEKWVTVTSPDLFKHGIDVDYKQIGCEPNSTAKMLPSVNSETKHSVQATTYTWTTNCQKQNAYVSVLISYVGMLFLFWIYGCWCSSAKCASHLNVDE